MGNGKVNNLLRKDPKYEVVSEDFMYIEAVHEFLKNNKVDCILVYQNIEIKPIINEIIKIKHMYMTLEIVYIYNNIKDSERKELKNNNIYKILNEKSFNLDILSEIIEQNQLVKYKENVIEKVKYDNRFLNKIITINGTEKSGKTISSLNIAKILSRKIKGKILIFDVDILDSDLDKFLNISEESVLVKIANEMMKKSFNEKMIENNIIKYNKKIDILTGNTSVFNCQNLLNLNIYNEILNSVKHKYETILIDTSSNIFIDSTRWSLEKADIIFYIFEGKINDVLKANKYIEFFISNWNIPQEKIKYIVSKSHFNSKNAVSNIFNRQIEGYISFNSNFVNFDNTQSSLKNMSEYENILYKDHVLNIKKIIENLKSKMKGIQNDY